MCLTPYHLKTGDDVPCGKCPTCRQRRANSWAFRLQQEEKRCTSAHFITLTYDTDSVPITKSAYLTLKTRDVQLFCKRLRKAHGVGSNIKYYAVGEYGGKSWRPHYHLILFNCRLELIQPAWPHGQVHYGTVTGASIGYTLKYICKPKRVPQHRNDDRQPEMSLMSKDSARTISLLLW